MKTYYFTYLCSAVLALVVTPIVIYIARVLGIYDNLDVRKVHTSAIPRIGGVAIFLSTIALVIVVLFLDNSIGGTFRGMQVQIVTLLAASTFIFLAGLVDDLRGLRVRYKLPAQIAAATALCLAGVRIDSLNIVNLFTIHLGVLSFPATIFWIITITNAVNLIDGLDGLAAGISAVTCAVIAIFAFDNGQPLMVVLMLALLGSLSGFLFFNFNPARIFMGDCGSMFLGFFLASSGIMCATKSETIVALALPGLALGLPIFDTIFSMVRRYLGRRGMMSPDRKHLHHKLLDAGLCQRHVVIAMYGLTVLAAGLGMFMMVAQKVGAVTIFFCVLLLLVLVFRVAGAVRWRETIAGLRRNHTISRQIRLERENFEKAELYFQQTETFEQWWQTICLAADEMNFTRSSLSLTNRDGTRRTLAWERKNRDTDVDDLVKVAVPVHDRRSGPVLNLEIEVHANGSIESVGRRIALFGRLIEQYSVANLPTNPEKSSEPGREPAEQMLLSEY